MNGSSSIAAIGVLILRLGFLGGAGFVWLEYDLSHYGQTTYSVSGMEGTDVEPEQTVSENASIIGYTDLPPNAQRAYEKVRRGEGNVLWSKDNWRAVETLLPYSGEYVEYQG